MPSYFLPVRIRQTAATASPITVWAMRAGTGRPLIMRRICLVAAFDGTAAASRAWYSLARFSAATPTGGTALTAIKARTVYPTSNMVDARFLDTGLTTTGVTFETALAYFGAPRQVNAIHKLDMVFKNGDEPLTLDQSEGLAIRTEVVAVIGDSIKGFVQWDEPS